MLTLKTYQQQALDALTGFLQRCRSQPVAQAFAATLAGQERAVAYQPIFGDTPAICLRIPTGGGKTLLAAHCIAATSRTLLDTDAPVTLWLTPSDTFATSPVKAGLPVKNGSINTPLSAKSRRKAECPNQVIFIVFSSTQMQQARLRRPGIEGARP